LLLYESLPGHKAEQLYDHHQFPAELLERQERDLNITEDTIPVLEV